MSLKMYLIKRGITYAIVFFTSLTIVWLLLRLAPGDPALAAVTAAAQQPHIPRELQEAYVKMWRDRYGLDKPLHEQYLIFWSMLLRGDLGVSPMVGEDIMRIIITRLRNDLILLVPATFVSWFIGNWVGAVAARYRKLDKILIPVIYILTSIPYFLMGLVLAYTLGVTYGVLPPVIRSEDIDGFLTHPSWDTFIMFIKAYTMPFLSLVLVTIGGWASGMRTLMIYELESNYARFMESLGFSERRVASYAFRYAINPQIAGLGIQLGTLIVAGIVVSAVFSYPGAGILLTWAIPRRDLFLIQGIAIIYIAMVIAANFIIDFIYSVIDPRIRLGVVGV